MLSQKTISTILVILLLFFPFTNFAYVSRLTVSSSEVGANASSSICTSTPDGRYLTFVSAATNLVVGDTNGQNDIFVRDTWLGTTKNVNSAATIGNGYSSCQGITPDGKYILFHSNATNLVVGDTNGIVDLFVKDMVRNTVVRVNVGNGGEQATNRSQQSFITSDGRFVFFSTYDDNFVAGDTNRTEDVFMRDLQNNTTTRVSVTNGGLEGNGDSSIRSISPDGRYIVFYGNSDNLVGGTIVTENLYVRDRLGRTTKIISSTAAGVEDASNSETFTSVTSDGRYYLFNSHATNLVAGDTNSDRDVFVKDIVTGVITRISQNIGGTVGNGSSFGVAITPDGKKVLFNSTSNNLHPSQYGSTFYHPFVKNITDGSISMVATSQLGVDPGDGGLGSAMTPDGKYVLFYGGGVSASSQVLDATDTNGTTDVYIKNMDTNQIVRINKTAGGVQANDTSNSASISSDGMFGLFSTSASTLATGDTNGATDIFLGLNADVVAYTGSVGYSFYYPVGLIPRQVNAAGSISVYLTSSSSVYNRVSPLVTIAKAPSGVTTAQLISTLSNSYKKLLRNNYTLTRETERTVSGKSALQLKFIGTQALQNKFYMVTVIKSGGDIYVISANGSSQYAADIEHIMDIIIFTRH